MIPAVTVIVTVYNRTQYLRQALESVFAQTFRSFEIIVTADSANEEIREICEAFGRPEVRYRRNPTTLGVALNLRAAMTEARGKYLAVLNDDDAWEPEFLEKLVAPLEQDARRVLAFGDHWVISESGEIDQAQTERTTRYYGRDVLPEGDVVGFPEFALEKNGVPLAMGSLFRKDAIDLDLIVKEVSGAYDYWIACLLAASGKGGVLRSRPVDPRYRVHGAMETKRQAPDKQENLVYIYRTLRERNAFPAKQASGDEILRPGVAQRRQGPPQVWARRQSAGIFPAIVRGLPRPQDGGLVGVEFYAASWNGGLNFGCRATASVADTRNSDCRLHPVLPAIWNPRTFTRQPERLPYKGLPRGRRTA